MCYSSRLGAPGITDEIDFHVGLEYSDSQILNTVLAHILNKNILANSQSKLLRKIMKDSGFANTNITLCDWKLIDEHAERFGVSSEEYGVSVGRIRGLAREIYFQNLLGQQFEALEEQARFWHRYKFQSLFGAYTKSRDADLIIFSSRTAFYEAFERLGMVDEVTLH